MLGRSLAALTVVFVVGVYIRLVRWGSYGNFACNFGLSEEVCWNLNLIEKSILRFQVNERGLKVEIVVRVESVERQ